MSWRAVMLVVMVVGGARAFASGVFPPPGISLPDYWGEDNVWWEGRTSFHGQVIVPACALAMEDVWQVVDMGATPVRDLQNVYAGPEKRFQLRLRDCELAGTGKKVFTGSRIRVTFDGVEGETPDKFSTVGQARGVNLQIMDGQGYTARAGKVMPAQLLEGNEQGLDYTLRVVRNGEPLKAGDYSASLRFKVDYE
ncbi:type 1 fimbrial protein [Salmonella enterica]|uniref:Type 1 fimbrial protein n=1 Tax=Salmonella enterica TaxID=28901 RepID=A0A5T8T483_SALER|nr:type 1 fimbrial protein [Salmonella enterica]